MLDTQPTDGPNTGDRTYRTTVYRLDGVPPDADGLQTALNHRYLGEQDFLARPATLGTAPALLVHGNVARDRAAWCGLLTRLTGEAVNIGHSSAGGALLVAVDEVVYALTYGTLGRHLISRAVIDPGFGIAFAIRAIGPDRVNRITRSVLATSGRVDRNLVPGGQHIRQFTVEQWGEIVAQISGPLTVDHQLTTTRLGARQVSIVGADSLQIPLGADPDTLLADLREITRVCSSATPAPELEFIAKIRPLPSGPRTAAYDQTLDELLGAADLTGLGMAVPASQVEDEALAAGYQLYIPGSGRSNLAEITADDLYTRLRNRPAGKRLDALKRGSIGLYSDDPRDLIGPATPAHKWLTAEIPDDAARVIYHEGRWYEIGAGHLDFLRAEVAALLDAPSTVALPPWTLAEPDEDAYNRKAVGSGYIHLDKRLLKTQQHRRGIEACDLLGPNGELICVKRSDSSSPLSHLFFQGEVAVDALLNEQDARQRLVDMVHTTTPDHWITPAFKPTKVVFAIALKSGKPLTADTLFTFSQVSLYRAVRSLRGNLIDVEVVGIPAS